jgi:hypothetical protein
MGFSIFVEMLNLRLRGKAEHPVKLHSPYTPPAEESAPATTAAD